MDQYLSVQILQFKVDRLQIILVAKKYIYLRVATVHQQFCLDLPVWKGHCNSMKPIITVGGQQSPFPIRDT